MSVGISFAKIDLLIRVPERNLGVGFGAVQAVTAPHVGEYTGKYFSGTGAEKVNRVWSGSFSSSVAVPLDLRGTALKSLADAGTAVTFPIVMGFLVKNRSTTTGQYLTVGGGSNPFISWLTATGDGVLVGPGGFHCIWSPIDGYATTEDTGDILTITPATGTIPFDVLLLGRSA